MAKLCAPRAGNVGTAALLLAVCGAPAAQAAIVISTGATQNIACFGGDCAPTAANAVLNIADLQALIDAGNVTITTTGSGIEAQDIAMEAPLTWSSSSTLTLDTYRSANIDQAVAVAGSGGVALVTGRGKSGGALSFGEKGHVSFGQLSSTLSINGSSYILLSSIHALAKAVAKSPGGRFALAKGYNAGRDGVYSSAPIPTNFVGTLEGLGNIIKNLSIQGGGNSPVGLFATIGSGGAVADLGLTHVDIRATSGPAIGALAGDNEGTARGDFVSGSLQGTDNGITGGLVGVTENEIMIACRSTATVTGGANGYAGGLLGRGGGLIADSHASGTITGGDGNWIGGLAGENDGQITQSDATGPVIGTSEFAGTFVGGLVGANSRSIDHSRASGPVTGKTGNIAAGGLVGWNPGSVANSSATGTVTATSANAAGGGLVGYSPGKIKTSHASGNVIGGDDGDIGGLVGINGLEVSTSYATGAVSGGKSADVGALVGLDTFDGVNPNSVTNSYALGPVTGGDGAHVGGFVGDAESAAHISSDYSAGSVSGGAGSLVGGFLGNDGTDGRSLSHDYWDTDTSGTSRAAGNLGSDRGVWGLTTAQLQSGLPAGFSAKVWDEKSGANGGLPYLRKNPPQ